jgi:hypothetical protein
MRDHLRRYRAIHRALLQGSPDAPHGQGVRPLPPWAAQISGMVGSPRTQCPKRATQGPQGTKPESRVTRLARWGDNATVTAEVSCGPFAEGVLRHRAWPPWVRIMDGSVVGRGWVALRLHVVYKGRAQPG